MAAEAQKTDLAYASSVFGDPKAGGLTVHPDDRLPVLLSSYSPRNRNVGGTGEHVVETLTLRGH